MSPEMKICPNPQKMSNEEHIDFMDSENEHEVVINKRYGSNNSSDNSYDFNELENKTKIVLEVKKDESIKIN